MQVSADARSFFTASRMPRSWVHAQLAPADAWPAVRQLLERLPVPVASEEMPRQSCEVTDGWLALDTADDKPAGTAHCCRRVGEGRTVRDQEHRFRMRVKSPVCRQAPAKIFPYYNTTSRSQGGDRDEWPRDLGQPLIWNGRCWPKMESYLSCSSSYDGQAAHWWQRSGGVGGAAKATLGQDGAGNAVLNLQADFNRFLGRYRLTAAWAGPNVLVTDLDRSSGGLLCRTGRTASSQEPRSPGFFGRFVWARR